MGNGRADAHQLGLIAHLSEAAMAQGQGRDKVHETTALECCVREALEAAAVQGLCHEGQLEAAVGALRAARPDLSAEGALTLVQRLARPNRDRP